MENSAIDTSRCKAMKDKNKAPDESLVRIFANGDFISSLLCTPKDLKELAFGWLFNQGLIESVDEIASLEACEKRMEVRIQLTHGEPDRGKSTKQAIHTSACMGGEIPYAQFFKKAPRLRKVLTVPLPVIRSLMKETLSLASTYRETGGIHCAAIASAVHERVLACFEDIGRHNALDKVLGWLLLSRQSPEDKLLLTSGRISSEMALKAAHNRIALIATITTCTNLAVRIADEAGLTLVGRALSSSPVVWCGDERIMYDN